jgi:hypothetical protein
MSNVIITLAHGLGASEAERLGLPAKEINPGTEVVVTDDVARGLIGAGYAAVETEKPREVAKALKRHAPDGHKVGLYEAPEADAKVADAEPKTDADPGPSGTQAAAKRGK